MTLPPDIPTPPRATAARSWLGHSRLGHIRLGHSKLGRFGVVSGLGLLLDFCIGVGLREAGVPAFAANLCGAAVAVTFVFFASLRRVFDSSPASKLRAYVLYVGFQALAVPLASMVIHALVPAAAWVLGHVPEGVPWSAVLRERASVHFFFAKVGFTPVTFYTNFLFMGWLLTGKVRWR
jgi:putative flippase GtrA